MTATGCPARQTASRSASHSASRRAGARRPVGRVRARRSPPRLRLLALPAWAVLAALLTGAPAASGAPALPDAPSSGAPALTGDPATSDAPAPVPAPPAAAATATTTTTTTADAVAEASAAAATTVTAAQARQHAWTWPVGPPRQLLRPFEAPAGRYAAGHRGIDLVAGEGDAVRSPADGVVAFVGTVVDRPVVSIQHGDDLLSSFEPVAATVSEGERVRAGQIIGVVATGAHCTARCVHFGVRRHGQYVSPVLFLGGLTRAVLLPLPPSGPRPLR